MQTTSIIYFITKRIAIEFLLIALSILTMVIISAYFKPLIISTAPSLDGREQNGWPLPFSFPYQEDIDGPREYKAEPFELGTFIADVLIFYAIIRLVIAALESIIHQYDLQQYKKLILSTTKRVAAMAIFLFLMYGAYLLRVNIKNVPREIFPIILK